MEMESPKAGKKDGPPVGQSDEEKQVSPPIPSSSSSSSSSPPLSSPSLFWRRLKSDFRRIPRKKVVVVGDENCGKTCLAMCFPRKKQNRIFCANYVPTVFENNLATIEFEENKKIELALWDTAGREKFDSLRPLCYVKCDVLLMCYSVDSIETMQSILRKWEPEAARYCPEALIVLVGLKTDLRDDRAVVVAGNDAQEIRRNPSSMVSLEQGQLLAEIIEAFGFSECSVKNNKGIDDIIRMVTNAALCMVKNKSTRKRRHSVNALSNNTSEDTEDASRIGYGCCSFFKL